MMPMSAREELADLLRRRVLYRGCRALPVPGLILLSGSSGANVIGTCGTLSLVHVVQGLLFEQTGTVPAVHEPGACLYIGAERRAAGSFAGRADFMALSMRISRVPLGLLARECEARPRPCEGLYGSALSLDIADELGACFLRLARLMDRPQQICVRAPILICEMHALLCCAGVEPAKPLRPPAAKAPGPVIRPG